MRSAMAVAGLFALGACSDAANEPAANVVAETSIVTATAAPERHPPGERAGAEAEAHGAAEVVKLYYGLIGERQFDAAWRLRELTARSPTAEQFAANYSDYAQLRANVGPASEAAPAGGWLYVEVPVQTYGRMRDGRPFGSAGTLTLRRRQSGGDWRIYGG